MRLICIPVAVYDMVILSQNLTIYLHSVQLSFVSVSRTAQTSLRIFLHTRIIVEVARFNSHDSGGHF